MKRQISPQREEEAGVTKKPRQERESHKKPSTFTLTVHPRSKFAHKFPYFRSPSEIGSFSLDADRKFYNDNRKLKYYAKPKSLQSVQFDLTDGYKDMVKKNDEADQFIDDLLHWVEHNRNKFALKSNNKDSNTNKDDAFGNINTDFICWRGLVTKLLCTPFEGRDGWLIAVSLYKGTYYMCEFETEKKKKDKEAMTERQEEMCYWGRKFEQYVTSDDKDGKTDTKSPVNENEAFCTVVRSRLESHSLVYAGEVDAIDDTSSNSVKYVEFKTTREIDTPRQDHNFMKFKLIKWWAQSYLVGIPKIVCGFRDDDGIVHRMQDFETLQIPNKVKDMRDGWKPSICFNFLNEFLSFVKRVVTVDDPKEVFLFEWEPRSDIICKHLQHGSKFIFLPEWYTKQKSENEFKEESLNI